jgi:pyridoxal 5'-phosphate synthase pdxT subunit
LFNFLVDLSEPFNYFAPMKIGVLDIQGSVEEHLSVLKILGVSAIRVKTKADLEGLNGLIIPGGESTTISKLLTRFNLRKPIIKAHEKGMAIWGTCAGAILLAKRVVSKVPVESLGLMDITVERNAYGRQLDSFETTLDMLLGPAATGRQVPAIFIRAPKIAELGKEVKVLAENDGWIVAAREGSLLATTFHPELSNDTKVHQYFLEICS